MRLLEAILQEVLEEEVRRMHACWYLGLYCRLDYEGLTPKQARRLARCLGCVA